MRQYKITTENLLLSEENDCYLAPDDPIHELKKNSWLGGLGSEAALARYNQKNLPIIPQDNRGKIQKEMNITPGTKEWFSLWFSNTGK